MLNQKGTDAAKDRFRFFGLAVCATAVAFAALGAIACSRDQGVDETCPEPVARTVSIQRGVSANVDALKGTEFTGCLQRGSEPIKCMTKTAQVVPFDASADA